MQNQNDCREWPNVLALNEKIRAVEAKISDCTDMRQRMSLRQEWSELLSKRYDQIQFNKEMYRKETA
jgi:hypothetical protein